MIHLYRLLFSFLPGFLLENNSALCQKFWSRPLAKALWFGPETLIIIRIIMGGQHFTEHFNLNILSNTVY